MSGQELFFAPSKDPRQLNPLVLAYIGDAVYEGFVRQFVISQANHRPNHLHRLSTKYVSAKAQARALEAWMPLLTEEEADIVRRGRNAKSGSSPKNTDILVYRHSTAFECLLGYLFYAGRHERLEELMRYSLELHGGNGTGETPKGASAEELGEVSGETSGEASGEA